jgi:radical SAM protein with 4Fe4S-binding SPASM domain
MPRHNKNDIFNFLSKLTFNKCWNALKVLGSYQLSKVIGRPFMLGLPLSISVEPTTACNLGCPECPSGLKSFTRPTGTIKMDFFRQTIDAMHKELFYLSFYFQGEPFIHRDFLSMVSHAHKRGMFTSTSTNAHFLTDEVARKTVQSGLSRLIISIDGTTQEVYEQYRVHGKLDKVLDGARHVIEQKRIHNSATPHIVFQLLVVAPNEHQIEDVVKLAAELKADEVRFKTAQVYDYVHGNPLLPKNERYSRYVRKADGTYRVKNALDNQCWRMWSGCVITWDGRVVPCCFDKDATHALGNLQEASLREVWHGSQYAVFRQALTNSRSEIDICTNCSEGTRVWTEA